jgi:hypothetical protein
MSVEILHATPPSWAGGNGNASDNGRWSTNFVPTSSDVVTVSTGSVTVDLPNLTFGSLTFSGGNLNGNNVLKLGNSAASNWSGGTMTFSSGGGVTVNSGATLGITGTGVDHDFNASALANSGTVNWSGGRLRSGNAGNISNSGTWNDTASTNLNNDFGGAAWTFTNNSGGTYNKSAAGTTTVEIGFTNNGTVNVSSGRLYLHGGGSSSGALNVSGSGNDIYIDSNYSLTNGSTVSGTVRAAAGTLTMSGNITASGLSIEGASVAGSHTLSGGSVSWTSGNFNASTTTTLTSTATLNISTSSDHDFSSHSMVNSGVVNWSGGRLRSGNGGTFTNNATFNDSASSEVNNDFGGTALVFTNGSSGTYNKTAAGQTKFLVPFNNSGQVNVNAGTLELSGGGTLSTGGTLTAASGASVLFSNDYTLADASALSGAGAFGVSNGTLTANGNVNVSNFGFSGGHLAGTQTFTGGLSWSGGDLNTNGTTTIGNSSSLSIAGVGDHDFSSRALVNNGTTNWTAGRLRSGNGGAFTNNGTFNDSASSDVNNDYGGTALTFTNASTGTYNKTAAGTSRYLVPFNNSGHVNVSAGTLELAGGGTLSTGATLNAAGGTNVVFSNSYTLVDASALSGSGSFSTTSGTLTANGNVTVSNFAIAGGHLAGTHSFSGTVGWSSGDLNSGGSTTITSASTFTISGAGDHDFSSRSVINNGTTNWNAGRLRSGNGGLLTNNGVFNDAASTDVNNDYGGTALVFTNGATGTYHKTASGETRFFVPFNNSGNVNVDAGTLNFSGGGTLAGGGTLKAATGAAVVFGNDYTLSDASSLTGNGSFTVNGGTLTATGNVNVSNFIVAGGHLAGTQTFNGGLAWSAGDLNNSGSTTIAAGSSLGISGSSDHDFSAHTIVNNGTTNWNGGRLRSGNGGAITNQGTFVDAASSDINNDYNGTMTVFTNASGGTYRKTGAGSTNIYTNFVNSGTLDIQVGDLVLNNNSTLNGGTTMTGSGRLKLASGLLTANGAMTFSNFQVAGGTVDGAHTFNGSTEWTAGNFNSSGSTTIGGTLTIDAGGDHDFSAHNFINNATVSWVAGAGRLRSGNGGQFNNNGAFNDAASNQWNNDYNGTTAVFFNGTAGSYNKNAAGTTTFNAVRFVNAGAINVAAGTLDLGGGGSSPVGAHFNASSGAALRFTSGNFDIADGSGFAGAGNFIILGGTVTIGTTISASHFELAGGTLGGISHTFTGGLTWSGGNMNSSGTTNIGAGGTLSITSSNDHDLSGHALVNNGTVDWTGGRLRSGNGGSITNNGVFNDSAGQILNNDYNGASVTFTNGNSGVYNKSGNNTSTYIVPFHNNGTVNVSAGVLTLNAGGNIGAGAAYHGAGQTLLTSGTFTANGSIQSDNLVLAGGTLAGNSQFHGLITFMNGILANGASTMVASDGIMVFSTSADHDMPGHSFVNNGVVNWNAGRIRGGNGATFTNNGVFNDQASNAVNNDYNGATFTFNNTATGIYNKIGSGTTTFGVPFTNQGTLSVTNGTMAFASTFTNQGNLVLANGATAQFAGPISFGTGMLAGNGTINASSVSAGGIVSPGASPGQLNIVGNFSLLSTSTLVIQLGGTNQGSGYDFLNVNGSTALSGSLNLSFVNNFQLSILPTNTFTVLTSNGTLSGAFANIASGQRLNTTDGLGSFKVIYGGGVNNVVLSDFIAVPEPSTYALMGFGLAAIGVVYRRRHRRR